MNVVIYSVTLRGYDYFFSPVAPTPGATFVFFSDRRPTMLGRWKWQPLPAETEGLSDTLANRYCKFFPHRLFPDADVTVYVDANVLICADLRPLIDAFLASGADMALFRHSVRTNIFDEYEASVRDNRIRPEDVETGRVQVAAYRAAGLPDDHVLSENAIIFRRQGIPALEDAMDLWWREMRRFTPRDQISLPYVLWRVPLRIMYWDWQYLNANPWFHAYRHVREWHPRKWLRWLVLRLWWLRVRRMLRLPPVPVRPLGPLFPK